MRSTSDMCSAQLLRNEELAIWLDLPLAIICKIFDDSWAATPLKRNQVVLDKLISVV